MHLEAARRGSGADALAVVSLGPGQGSAGTMGCMAIPDFQSIMLPLLRDLSDGREHTNRATLESLSLHFGLTEEERAELLPSGRAPLFYNRIAWAKVHLKGAGLIESPRRGSYRITDRGREVLAREPERVDIRLLKTFSEYQELRAGKKDDGAESMTGRTERPGEQDELTPEEHIEYGHAKVREELAAELLKQVKDASPAFFEHLVVELLLGMGYGGSRKDAGSIVGSPGDGGIDGIIKEDRLGLDVIYIQAKRWESTVDRPEIQKFAGALQGQRAKKGIFLTTSDCARGAIEYASRIDSRIVLVDGRQLADLMIDHGIGVTRVATYDVQRIDNDYFEEG